jgi:uncharacterized protein
MTVSTAVPQHSLVQSAILHLAPGAIFALAVASAIAAGVDPVFALFGGIGVVLVPMELGYLSLYARRKLLLLAAGLAAWFLLVLVLSIALLDEWLADNVFAWMPDSLLEFARVEGDEEEASAGAVAAFLLIALAFNGIAGPVTEELYFRGHLLPRIERLGRGAPVFNTVLFAIYHFFSPWRYVAIIVGFLPITWVTWRNRCIFVAIGAHVTINMITVLLLLAALLSSQ